MFALKILVASIFLIVINSSMR